MTKLLKIVILGSTGSGKTTLLSRFSGEKIIGDTKPTIGASYTMIPFQINGVSHNLHIWDTAGQETYRATSPFYCRDSRAAMIVYDITSMESFNELETWIGILKEQGNIPFVLVGNKIDLENERAVVNETGQNLAQKWGAEYFETSAVTGDGCENVIGKLAALAINPQEDAGCKEDVVKLVNDKEKSYCC